MIGARGSMLKSRLEAGAPRLRNLRSFLAFHGILFYICSIANAAPLGAAI
jgi:hypothetical protein